MAVHQFGLLTLNKVNNGSRNQGIGAQYRAQNKYDAQIARALGLNRRVGKGSRFHYDQNLKYNYNYSEQTAQTEEKKFNWGTAIGGGLSMGLSGAAVGAACGGGLGAIIGGAVGLLGGFFAGGFS